MDNQYMDMFLDESHEHLQSLNEGLLRLEENMEEVSAVNDIFRNAHTLKGMSATMGFTKIAELTHEMEDVLDLVRKEQLKLNEDIMDTAVQMPRLFGADGRQRRKRRGGGCRRCF